MRDPRTDPDVTIPVQWLKWAREVGGDAFNIEYARRLAEDLMAEHGVSDWALRVGRGRDQAGRVDYRAVRGRWDGKPGTVTLSGPLMSLWTPDQARTTILHEIAHILCPDAKHGPLWKAHCRRLGIKPHRLWGEGGEQQIEGAWVGTCPGGHTHRRRRRKPRQQWSCTKCNPVWDHQYIITWTKQAQDA
jgi:hypothetical protein